MTTAKTRPTGIITKGVEACPQCAGTGCMPHSSMACNRCAGSGWLHNRTGRPMPYPHETTKQRDEVTDQ